MWKFHLSGDLSLCYLPCWPSPQWLLAKYYCSLKSSNFVCEHTQRVCILFCVSMFQKHFTWVTKRPVTGRFLKYITNETGFTNALLLLLMDVRMTFHPLQGDVYKNPTVTHMLERPCWRTLSPAGNVNDAVFSERWCWKPVLRRCYHSRSSPCCVYTAFTYARVVSESSLRLWKLAESHHLQHKGRKEVKNCWAWVWRGYF